MEKHLIKKGYLYHLSFFIDEKTKKTAHLSVAKKFELCCFELLTFDTCSQCYPLSLANHLEHLRGARALLNTPLVLFQRVIGVNQAQTAPSERATDNWAAREQTRIILGDSQRRRRATICLFIYSSRTDKGERTRDPIAQMSRPCVLRSTKLRKAPPPRTMGSVLFCLLFSPMK